MKKKKITKLNNQGFSLLELLVAMAIAGIVALLVGSLMSNASVWYSGETAKADVQNDIQTINTKLQKVLMEATVISVYKDSGVQYILTGEWDSDAGKWKESTNPNGTARAIIIYGGEDDATASLYITDTYYEPGIVISGGISEGYKVSSNLKKDSFNAELEYTAESGKVTSDIVAKISYEMLKNNKTSRSNYKVTLRNSSSITQVVESGSAVMLKPKD